MRISTYQYYENIKSNINNAKDAMDMASSEISSGKKDLAPIDVARSELNSVRISRVAQDIKNNNWLNDSLTEQENSLDGAINTMLRLKEIAVSSNNDSLTPSDKKALAVESDALFNGVRDFLNTKNVNNEYVFGSFSGDVKPFDNNGNYAILGSSREIIVYEDSSIKYSLDNVEFNGLNLNNIKNDIGLLNSTSQGLNISNIDSALSILNYNRSKIGTLQNTNDTYLEQNKNKDGMYQKVESSLSEVDMTKAITDFQKNKNIYEATLKMSSMMTSSNLFNYI